jgi:hypothetical protein
MTRPIGSIVNRFAIGLSRDEYSPTHIDLFAAEFFMETLTYSALLARGCAAVMMANLLLLTEKHPTTAPNWPCYDSLP